MFRVNSVKSEEVAGVALAIRYNSLIAESFIAARPRKKVGVDSRRQNGELRETTRSEWNGLHLFGAHGVTVRCVCRIEQRCGFDGHGRRDRAWLQLNVYGRRAVTLHENLGIVGLFESVLGKGHLVSADGKICNLEGAVTVCLGGDFQIRGHISSLDGDAADYGSAAIGDLAVNRTQCLLCKCGNRNESNENDQNNRVSYLLVSHLTASEDMIHPLHGLVRRARISVKTKLSEHLWIFLKNLKAADSGALVLEEEERTLKTGLHDSGTTQTRHRRTLRVEGTLLIVLLEGRDHKSGALGRSGGLESRKNERLSSTW